MKRIVYAIIAVFAATVLAPEVLAQVRSRNIKQSLAFYETHQKRLIFALGEDVVSYSTDFTDFPDAGSASDPVGWTSTMVEVGAGTTEFDVTDASGGLGRITTAADDNDGGNFQLLGEAFELTSDQELYCGFFGVTISDATQSDFFLGLAVTDTDILGGVTDRIGFQSVDASAAVTFPVEKDSTETNFDPSSTMSDATAVDLEFYYDGSGLEIFIDGASGGNPAVTNLPDNEALRLTIQFLNGASGAETMDIDRITCIQIGR